MFKEDVIAKVGFIGSGKVATQMAIVLSEKGIDVAQIYSRNYKNASILAAKVNALAIESVKDFVEYLDLIIVSISDSAFNSIDLSAIGKDIMIVHTSGSLPMDYLKNHKNYGVFYPLQTFNKFDKTNWDKIPICIEANSTSNTKKLKVLAKLLSNSIFDINSRQRAVLHLSAVFVCNFTNAMYVIGDELLDESEINIDILRPLIEQTAINAINNSPKQIQTGPATRNDTTIIEKHIRSLEKHKDYAEIYKLMTKVIYKQQNNI